MKAEVIFVVKAIMRFHCFSVHSVFKKRAEFKGVTFRSGDKC